MTVNPLVAGPVDMSSPLGGTMLLESLGDLAQALDSGSWLDIGLAAFSTAMDTAAAVSDPLGQLLAAGLGWLMEHMEPLKGWLNDLTGDAGAVAGFAATWDNIAKQMSDGGDELERVVRADLEGMSGAGVGAYGLYATDLAAHIRGLSASSSSVASSLRTCSTIVKVVHDLVRDALAELVGAAISWAAEIVLTVGLGTPWVIEQVTTRVSALATRVGTKVTQVISSGKALKQLIEALKEAIESLARNLRNAKPGGAHGPDAPGAPHAPDAPHVPARTPLPDVSDLRHMMEDAYRTVPPDAARLQEWAEAVASRHGDGGLTAREVLDIHWYTTTEGCDAMNRAARSGLPVPPEIQARMDSATSGLSRLPVYEGTTFRGTNLPDGVLHEWVPGNTVHDPAFTSTSTDPSIAEEFRSGGNALIRIDGGHSGVDVQQLSYYGREAEILFGRSSPLEVLNRTWNPAGFWDFVVRDVAP